MIRLGRIIVENCTGICPTRKKSLRRLKSRLIRMQDEVNVAVQKVKMGIDKKELSFKR